MWRIKCFLGYHDWSEIKTKQMVKHGKFLFDMDQTNIRSPFAEAIRFKSCNRCERKYFYE